MQTHTQVEPNPLDVVIETLTKVLDEPSSPELHHYADGSPRPAHQTAWEKAYQDRLRLKAAAAILDGRSLS